MVTAFHKIMSHRPRRKHVESTKRLRSFVRNPPPLSSPSFSAHIAKVQDTVQLLRASDDTDAICKIHKSLVCGCQMKKVVTETLYSNDMHPTVVRDPATGWFDQDPVGVPKILGSSLQHLGWDPSYRPPREFVEEVLAYSPSCPATAALQAIPYFSWTAFAAHMKHNKPSKAGGSARTNNVPLTLAP